MCNNCNIVGSPVKYLSEIHAYQGIVCRDQLVTYGVVWKTSISNIFGKIEKLRRDSCMLEPSQKPANRADLVISRINNNYILHNKQKTPDIPSHFPKQPSMVQYNHKHYA